MHNGLGSAKSKGLLWEDSFWLQNDQMPNVQILLKNLEVSGMQLDERAKGLLDPCVGGAALMRLQIWNDAYEESSRRFSRAGEMTPWPPSLMP